jgi:hypothetical protein
MITRGFLSSALLAGAAAAASTTATLAWIGARRDRTPYAPFNAVSHIAWGGEAAWHTEPSIKYTLTGALLNAAAVMSWAGIFEGLLRARRPSVASTVTAGVATTALAYVVDYHVVPRRLTPGFELRLPTRSLLPIYGSLAGGLIAGALLARRSPRATPDRG